MQILALMEELEGIVSENEGLKVWLEEQEVQLSEKKSSIARWMDECVRDQDRLDSERAVLVQDIPRDFMSFYQRVFKGRNGRAVVPVLDGICQECHLQIPPQDYNELQRNDKLMSCPHCDRIIYWQDHEDFMSI